MDYPTKVPDLASMASSLAGTIGEKEPLEFVGFRYYFRSKSSGVVAALGGFEKDFDPDAEDDEEDDESP